MKLFRGSICDVVCEEKDAEENKVREIRGKLAEYGVITPQAGLTALFQRSFKAQDPWATVEIPGHFDPLLSFFLPVARYKLRIVEPPKLPMEKKPNPGKDGE